MNLPTYLVIAVVDGDASRYEFLERLQQDGLAHVVFVKDVRSALRLSHVLWCTHWLIDSQLSDLRGIDCIEMLIELQPQARFFLIADTYDVLEERLCFRFSRVKYLCRPMDVQWLSRLLRSQPPHRSSQRPPSGATTRRGGQRRTGLERSDPPRGPPP